MAVAKQVAYIEVDQVTVETLIDGTDVVGGTAEYEDPIHIPDIMELTVNLEVRSVRREGDARIKGVYAKVVAATGTIRHNSVPLNALAAMGVGTLQASGSTPNQRNVFTASANKALGYFRLTGRAVHVEGIDGIATGAKLVIPKCKLTGNIPFALNQEWASMNSEFTAVALESEPGDVLYFEVEETQSDLLNPSTP